jgi:hypothetical protein
MELELTKPVIGVAETLREDSKPRNNIGFIYHWALRIYWPQ